MRPENNKRRLLLESAASLFAVKRFDEVKLDDIAARARLGKGTVYLYFKSKEDLYAALIVHALECLLNEIGALAPEQTPARTAWRDLGQIVDVLLAFARRNPNLDSLMRATAGVRDPRIRGKREELADACEQIIRRGVRSGEFCDPHPELTAQYILSFVRIALLYSPPGMRDSTLRTHILRVLGNGIRAGDDAGRKRNARRGERE